MRLISLRTALVAAAACLSLPTASRADFVLTNKNDANPATIPSGNTATSVYVMETRDAAFTPTPSQQTVPGFEFDGENGSGAMLVSNASGDFKQGYSQSLAGNAENGYVGTVLGKPWGNAITLSFSQFLVNGPGADLYVTAKNLLGVVAQSTSTQDKSFDIAFHVINQGALNGWHLYAANVLPTNFQPADGPGNVLGAIDLGSLPFGSGNNVNVTGLPLMPGGILIDKISLVNSNSANGHAWGFLGNTSEAPTGFVARRDFDNADLDNDAFTGVDYLTGRYGTRSSNGQDGPQAWFVGLSNTAIPESSSFLAVGLFGVAVGGGACFRRKQTA